MRYLWIIELLLISQLIFSQNTIQEKKSMEAKIKAKTEQLINKYQFFDDFIQNFSSDSSFQKSRVIFPLVYNKIGKVDTLNKANWIYKQFYYLTKYEATAIKIYCDSTYSKKDSVYQNDTRDIIYIDESHKINKYGFVKTNKFWFLSELEYRDMNSNDDFISYLLNISKDSLTQINSIIFPVFQRTIDKESDDFHYVDKFISIDKWTFNPSFTFIESMIPLEIYNCNSDYRLFIYYGLDNGIHDEYLFKKIKGKWKLIGIYELSM